MLPGPAIEVCQNDELSVTVFNNMHFSEGLELLASQFLSRLNNLFASIY